VGAVALAIGGLLPKVSHVPRERFVALGVAYGLLALVFVIGGSLRDRAARRAIAVNSFAELPPWAVTALTTYLAVLIVPPLCSASSAGRGRNRGVGCRP
jgi:membrane associated rhomboid family serine protease